MKNAARIALATVLLLGAAIVLPRPAGRLLATDAIAQITPTIPDLFGTPTPTNPPDPGGGGEEEDPGGGGGGGGGGGEDPDDGKDGDGKDGKDGRDGDGKDGKDGRDGDRKKKKKDDEVVPPSGVPSIPGSFDTDKLVAIAARLRALGMSQEEVIRRVYPPFIIAGPATWIDTWGAPRYGPGPIVRTHEGQDVFCNYGDPILAPEAGIVDFSDGGLGGITARVHVPSSGRYWYLTHLSDLNTEEFSIGDHVEVGDVLGYCGNSGNAATTSPHVHFGWYAEGGTGARNPMRHLVDWLREAERRVLGVVTKTTERRVKQQPTLTAARRFGDAFTPDLSELRIAGESLWASGSDPASGAFVIAESALQAALSGSTISFDERGRAPIDLIGAGPESDASGLDPNSALARLLADRDFHPEGSD
ncbi:MAG: M23 family metallopeptidase [Actinomycetota bacterium]